jgi:DNA-directed RNA polymerase II subunit RPB1
MTVTFQYSSAPVKQIREIQFGVMSPEEIVRGQAMKVVSAG